MVEAQGRRTFRQTLKDTFLGLRRRERTPKVEVTHEQAVDAIVGLARAWNNVPGGDVTIGDRTFIHYSHLKQSTPEMRSGTVFETMRGTLPYDRIGYILPADPDVTDTRTIVRLRDPRAMIAYIQDQFVIGESDSMPYLPSPQQVVDFVETMPRPIPTTEDN